MTVLTHKKTETPSGQLQRKKTEILVTISSLRKDLRNAPQLKKQVDPKGLLIKNLNRIENLIPHITTSKEARELQKQLRDFKVPVAEAKASAPRHEFRNALPLQ